MTYQELNLALINLPYGDYLIEIAYKYEFENIYTTSIEAFSVSIEDMITWFCDWYEGQHNIEVHGILPIMHDSIHEALIQKSDYYMSFIK